MENVSHHSAADIAGNSILDAGSFFLPVPPFLSEQWGSSGTPNTPGPADNHRPQVVAESIQRALIRNIDALAGAEMQHPENTITGIHDEGLLVIRRLASGSVYWTTAPWSPSKATSTLLETEGSPGSAERQTDINLADDTDRNRPQEGVSMNLRLGHGHPFTRIHTTSTPSALSIPQGIPSNSTVQYPGESESRDRSQKLQKPRNVPEKASSQLSRPPAGIGRTLYKGPYPCYICGKRYAQRQGVRRHYRAIHGHLNSCSFCSDFKWSRPYLYRAHLRTKHRDVVSDVAQGETTWTSYRAANTASSPQQQQVLTLTPEDGQRGGTETRLCQLTPFPSAAIGVASALSLAIQRFDHDANWQPSGSAEPTTRRKRKREDALGSEPRTDIPSTEVRAQLAKDQDILVRKVKTRFQDKGSPLQSGYGGNLVVEAPTDRPYGSHIFPSCPLTHYDEIRERVHRLVRVELKPTIQ